MYNVVNNFSILNVPFPILPQFNSAGFKEE